METEAASLGKRIQRLRTKANLTQRQLREATGLSQTTIHRIETGEKAARIDELLSIAWAVGCPISHLLRNSAIRERATFAARVSEDEAPLEAVADDLFLMLELDEHLDQQREENNIRMPEMAALSTANRTNEDAGREEAEQLREKFNLGTAPIADLQEFIETSIGIDVAIIAMPHGVDGALMVDDVRRITIAAATTTTSPERQRFTLAHEVGHIIFSDSIQTELVTAERTPREIRADAFARHLLAPLQGVRLYLESRGAVKGQISERDIAFAARYFDVSPQVMLIQLSNLNWITQAASFDCWKISAKALANRYGWGADYDANAQSARQRRAPQRLVERATKGYQHNLVSLQTLAQLRDVDVDTLETEFASSGIAPKPTQVKRVDLDALMPWASA